MTYNGSRGHRVSSSPLKFLQEFIISRFVEPELLTVKKIVKDVALTIEASCTYIELPVFETHAISKINLKLHILQTHLHVFSSSEGI